MSRPEPATCIDTDALTSVIDRVGFLDRDLVGHATRISPLVTATLERLPNITRSDRDLAQATALLHDVGKAGIPAEILLNPSTLTSQELAIVRRHPAIGANFVAAVLGNDILAAAIRHHHEWWNGRGYPSGLSGDRIPLLSRVVGVADAFDAMTTERPYRAARDVSFALDELARCAATQFDPAVVVAFTSAITMDPSSNEYRVTT